MTPKDLKDILLTAIAVPIGAYLHFTYIGYKKLWDSKRALAYPIYPFYIVTTWILNFVYVRLEEMVG